MSDQLTIKLFATLRDRAGRSTISVPLVGAQPVSVLLETIAAHYPALAEVLPVSLVAVNRDFSDADTLVRPHDEVAIFPPVSGG